MRSCFVPACFIHVGDSIQEDPSLIRVAYFAYWPFLEDPRKKTRQPQCSAECSPFFNVHEEVALDLWFPDAVISFVFG
jgi:hypothetical protein